MILRMECSDILLLIIYHDICFEIDCCLDNIVPVLHVTSASEGFKILATTVLV